MVEKPSLMRRLTIGKRINLSASISDILFMLRNARIVGDVVDWLHRLIFLFDEVLGCFFDFEL